MYPLAAPTAYAAIRRDLGGTRKGCPLQDRPVREGPPIALIGVAAGVFFGTDPCRRRRADFSARRKKPAPPQPRRPIPAAVWQPSTSIIIWILQHSLNAHLPGGVRRRGRSNRQFSEDHLTLALETAYHKGRPGRGIRSASSQRPRGSRISDSLSIDLFASSSVILCGVMSQYDSRSRSAQRSVEASL